MVHPGRRGRCVRGIVVPAWMIIRQHTASRACRSPWAHGRRPHRGAGGGSRRGAHHHRRPFGLVVAERLIFAQVAHEVRRDERGVIEPDTGPGEGPRWVGKVASITFFAHQECEEGADRRDAAAGAGCLPWRPTVVQKGFDRHTGRARRWGRDAGAAQAACSSFAPCPAVGRRHTMPECSMGQSRRDSVRRCSSSRVTPRTASAASWTKCDSSQGALPLKSPRASAGRLWPGAAYHRCTAYRLRQGIWQCLGHRGELDVHALERLLQPIRLVGPFLH
jgi:hypothetical protein